MAAQADFKTQSATSILKKLSIEEKVSLLSGETYWRTPAIPRVGIPAIKAADGPNGCRGEAIHASTKSSCFPCGSCIGATFNPDLVRSIGAALGKEAQLKNAGVLLGPTINIHRHPYGGRNFESFSEDPVLSGELAAAYVLGLQSENVAACPKHFVCNECEESRNNSNSIVDEKTLREMYLLPFQICMRKAKPWALMTAYNKVNGQWCSENEHLMHILREEWNFDGCTISDFEGVYTDLAPIKAGLNLEMPGPSIHRGQKTLEALRLGSLVEDDIDTNALRVIELAQKVGMADATAPEKAVPNDETSSIIRRAAEEGMVLLKNEASTLPLPQDPNLKVAVFGAPASTPIIHGGGSSTVNSHFVVTPLQALQAQYPNLEYCYGVPIFRKIPSAPLACMKTATGEPGVDCHWYNGWTFENEILHERLETTRTLVIDPRIPGLQQKHCSRMQFTLTPQTTGVHTFGVTACGECHIFVDGQEVVSHPGFTDTQIPQIMQPGLFERKGTISMVAGKAYNVVIDTLSTTAPPPPPPALQLSPQATQVGFFENLGHVDMKHMEDVAKASDVTLIFTGNNKEWESESFDRTQLSLSEEQNTMISALAAVSRKTIVINQTGAPITMPWLGEVEAVIQNWFAGMEVGNALARILTGMVSPSGRLPTTFPAQIEDVPSNLNFPVDENLDIAYQEALNVGYRNLLNPQSPAPLFPFGYGLSYAQFKYSDLSLSREPSCESGVLCIASVAVSNVSAVAAMETVQLYVDGILKAIAKPSIPAGETSHVKLHLDKYAFSTWNLKEASWEIEPKRYLISIQSDALTPTLSASWIIPASEAGFWKGT